MIYVRVSWTTQIGLFPLTGLPCQDGKMHPSAPSAHAHTRQSNLELKAGCFHTQPLINSMYSPHHAFRGFARTLFLLNQKIWGQGHLTYLHVSVVSNPRALTMNVCCHCVCQLNLVLITANEANGPPVLPSWSLQQWYSSLSTKPNAFCVQGTGRATQTFKTDLPSRSFYNPEGNPPDETQALWNRM